MTILQDVSQSQSVSETDMLKAELAKVRAENARLLKAKVVNLSLKVSEKGAVSLYGIRRFPVTFYRDEWLKILAKGEDITRFISVHANELSSKTDED